MNISFLINYECISRSLSAVYMFVVACAKYYRNCVPKNALKYHKYQTLNKTPFIRESVDSLCRDGTEMRRTLKASKLRECENIGLRAMFSHIGLFYFSQTM